MRVESKRTGIQVCDSVGADFKSCAIKFVFYTSKINKKYQILGQMNWLVASLLHETCEQESISFVMKDDGWAGGGGCLVTFLHPDHEPTLPFSLRDAKRYPAHTLIDSTSSQHLQPYIHVKIQYYCGNTIQLRTFLFCVQIWPTLTSPFIPPRPYFHSNMFHLVCYYSFVSQDSFVCCNRRLNLIYYSSGLQ